MIQGPETFIPVPTGGVPTWAIILGPSLGAFFVGLFGWLSTRHRGKVKEKSLVVQAEETAAVSTFERQTELNVSMAKRIEQLEEQLTARDEDLAIERSVHGEQLENAREQITLLWTEIDRVAAAERACRSEAEMQKAELGRLREEVVKLRDLVRRGSPTGNLGQSGGIAG